jgi:16S rRNA (adenine1518-N6/adenine1519-N6)-dimethyltransferase
MYEPIKSLGQNFLSKAAIVEGILDALDVSENDNIIEIGPGHGILTEALGKRITGRNISLCSVEIDERFVEKLYRMFAYEPNIEIVHADILKWLPDFTSDGQVKIFGSLPYYITSPILHTVIKMQVAPLTAVFLIQKEVAEKVCSKSPDSTYLSSFIQTFYDAEYLFTISKEEFRPVPKVDGAVIKLVKNDTEMSAEIKEKYEGFLHRSFSHPRKMLNKPFSKEELAKGDIDPKLRPQNLSAEEWLKFFTTLRS